MYEYIGAEEWEGKSVYDLARWKNGLAFRNIDFSISGKPVLDLGFSK